MDNIPDYILSFQNYKKGIYDFETISSPEEIKKAVESGIPEEVKNAVESGKKFVCVEEGSVWLFVVGVVLILVGILFELFIQLLFRSLSLPYNRPPITVFLSVLMFLFFLSLGLYCIVLELLILRKPFIVLGAEGIAYKLRTGGIKGSNWENISMDCLEFLDQYGQYKNMIRISLKNGSLIKLGNGNPEKKGRFYTSKEFPNEKLIGRNHASRFLFLTFSAYYNYAKYGTFEKRKHIIFEDVQNIVNNNSLDKIKEVSYYEGQIKETYEDPNFWANRIVRTKENENYLDELKEAYRNYKKNKYTFGNYETAEQIRYAHANGKIFVLKGGSMLIWVCFITTLILSVWWFILLISSIVIIFSEPSATLIGISILALTTIGFFTVVPCIMLGLFTRMFLVIGPSGVYHRKITKIGSFQWRDVTFYEGRIDTLKPRIRDPPVKTAQVTIILPNDEIKRFVSMAYQNKEFARTDKRYLFIRLFQIYSELGKS